MMVTATQLRDRSRGAMTSWFAPRISGRTSNLPLEAAAKSAQPMAMRHTRATLQKLDSQLAPAVASRLLEIARIVLSDKSTYPSITSDGSKGAVAVWKCDNFSIEIDIEPGNLFYVREREGEIVREWYEGAFPFAQVKSSLDRIARITDRQNPAWRRSFLT